MIDRRLTDNALMAANVGIRLGYGIGGVVAPSALAKLRFAPSVGDRPDARLFVRGFAVHQVGVAALGVASWRWPGLRRAAVGVAAILR